MRYAEIFNLAQDGATARRASWADGRRVFYVAADEWELRRTRPAIADAALNGFMAVQVAVPMPDRVRSTITPFEPSDADRLADDWEIVNA